MVATIQRLCFCGHSAILRLHAAASAELGDPYVWWTCLRGLGDGQVEIMGADRPVPRGGVEAINAALRAAGFTRRVHHRIAGGRVRTVIKDL